MNGLYLVIISALVFVLAYRFYGAFIAAKVLTINQYKVTPAFRFEDGHDYVPTNQSSYAESLGPHPRRFLCERLAPRK